MGTSMYIRTDASSRDETASKLTFKELSQTVSVGPKASAYIAFDAGSHRYELKTISMTIDKAIIGFVEFMDKKTSGSRYYWSNSQNEVYDIVNVPATDKDGTQKVHCLVTNESNESANFTVTIKIIPMFGGNV